MAPPAVERGPLQARGGVEKSGAATEREREREEKNKKRLRSAELLRGSQIIFGLEQTVEKGKGCV